MQIYYLRSRLFACQTCSQFVFFRTNAVRRKHHRRKAHPKKSLGCGSAHRNLIGSDFHLLAVASVIQRFKD